MFVEEIKDRHGLRLAMILRGDCQPAGYNSWFPSDRSDFLQVGFGRYQQGAEILPHVHEPRPRQVMRTEEVLFVSRGELRVDFYDERRVAVAQRTVKAGDALILLAGGHGFRALTEVELWEVKQGPFDPALDKARFVPVEPPKPMPPEGYWQH